MNLPRRAFLLSLICLTLSIAARASAQTKPAQEPYTPVVGQEGKDAVWVPTSDAMVEKMLDHAKVTPEDFVIDLGSGDGRTIIAAAKRGARGLGVEFNADLVEFSKRKAAEAGVGDKAAFVQGDMYAADISKATVLALFLLPRNLEQLLPKFLALPAGTRIVVNTYWVADWQPDDTQTLENCSDSWCTSHMVIVPAKVEGRWRLPEGTLALTQRFQMLEGTFAPAAGGTTPVKGRLRGNQLTLTLGGTEYEGTVNGNTFRLSPKNGAASPLSATRVD